MRALFIALGVAATVWCFMTHQPMWVCCLNVGLDVLLVLGYLKNR